MAPLQYDPRVQPVADQYIFKGITGLGEGIASAMQEAAKKAQKGKEEAQNIEMQTAYNDGIMQKALLAGRISQDEKNAYDKMSWPQKVGKANAVSANIASDLTQQNAATTQLFQRAHAAALLTQANQNMQPFDPQQRILPPPPGAPPGTPGRIVIPTSPKSIQVIPTGAQSGPSEEQVKFAKSLGWNPLPKADGSFQWVQDPKKASYNFEALNKEVQAASGVDLGVWSSNLQHRDEEAGKVSVVVPRVNKVTGVPVTTKVGDKEVPMMDTHTLDIPTYDKFVAKYNALNAPPAAPPDTPAPQAAAGGAAMAKAAQIKADYAAGKLSRAKATEALKEIGFQD